MTANQMKDYLIEQLDAVQSDDFPEISDEQCSVFLNDAVLFHLNNIIKEGVEKDTKNRNFIAPLKRSGVSNSNQELPENKMFGRFFDLNNDYYYMLSCEVEIDKIDCITGKKARLRVLPITEEYYSININNSEKNPYYAESSYNGLVWSLIFDKHPNKFYEIITDGNFFANKLLYRYLKYPNKIVVNTENPQQQQNLDIREEFHIEIIHTAALLAIENLRQNSRFQSKATLNTVLTK